MRILVAEDHPVNRRVIVRLLNHKGYETATASNGHEVLEALRAGDFNLVLMDCLMPGQDGFESTRIIRACPEDEWDPDIPIIAITALSAADDRDRCLECGMDDFITKPVRADELYQRIERFLPAPLDEESGSAQAPERACESPEEVLSRTLRAMSSRILQEAQQACMNVSSAVDASDWQGVAHIAHRTRGMAELLVDSPLSKVAAKLEAAAKTADEAMVRERVHGFQRNLRRLIRTLEESS